MNQIAKKFFIIILLCAVCFPGSGITIKLGTLLPKNSPWELAFRQIALKWAEISDGTVDFKIYAGGIVGDEEEMIRKMRIGQLNAAALSGLGINKISPSILTLYIPFMLRDDDEVDYVLGEMSDDFKNNIEDNGYTVISWIMGGWIYLFSKEPVVIPGDLMRQKLLIPPNDQSLVLAWREAGFTVVELSLTDIIIGLQTDMVEAFYSTPIVASFDYYNYADNMCSMKLAPLIGGFIISNSTWERIPEDIRPELIEAASGILEPLYCDTKRIERETIESMQKYGLKVNPVNECEREQWVSLVDIGFQVVLGKTIPVDTYNKLCNVLEEFRESN
jgi:TRAP-type C4-dicarboxylate transport system substrate-binding protein